VPAGPGVAEGGVDPSELAAAGGYADQSHLYREFRALAGLTPAQASREWTAGRHSKKSMA
jgi:AraC-like DNA-binding protein